MNACIENSYKILKKQKRKEENKKQTATTTCAQKTYTESL